MIEWLDDFYADPGLRSTLLKSFLPVFSNYVAEATGGPVAASFVQALAESYVDRHLGSSRSQLQEVVKGSTDPLADLSRRFDEWEEKRPGKVAANELVRSANAASVEKMREAGVTKMVWRASGGKTCPFCTELDGTIISVDGTFFQEGDELNPEGATAPIHFESSLGHPPVHQGCVCSVEAVTETEAPPIVQGQPLTHDEVFGSDTIIPPGQPFGDRRMHVISQRQGFDALPHVVSKDELDGYVAAGEREWFRGVEGGPNFPVRPLTDQYRTGDRVYQGHGVFGNGTYASAGDGYAKLSDGSVVPGLSSRELATAYARDADGAVMRGTIRSDARVLEVTGEEALAWSRSGEWQTITESSMAQGYDVLLIRDGSRMYTKIAGEFADEFGDQVVILNRSAVRVQSEDLPGGS